MYPEDGRRQPGAAATSEPESEVGAFLSGGVGDVARSEPTRHGPWKLAAVAILAVIAFAAALTRFPDARLLTCSMPAHADPSYDATVSLAPTLVPASRQLFIARQSTGVTVRLAVNREGRPVSGAAVCVVAFPVKQASLGISDAAHQVGPGQYDVLLEFDPPGLWSAKVGVIEPLRPAVAIPVRFTVPFPPPS